MSEIQELRMHGNYTWYEINFKQNVSNIEDLFFFNENDQNKIQKPTNEQYYSQTLTDFESAKSDIDEIFIEVEQNAEFFGGPRAFVAFLQRNLRYPSAAQRANVGGKVYIQFVVNTDGTIQDVTVLKSVGFGCDEEAVRVIKAVPRWTPGKQSGRAVRSRFTQPITFVLSE